jgi:predicted nucleic-acid-binding protein
MIGLDTNVLVHYVVPDDPDQYKRAEHFIQRQCTIGSPGYINRVVLCEFVWVLQSIYGYAREQVADAVERLLQTVQFVIEDHHEASLSLSRFRAGADFAGSFIAAVNQLAGCKETVTFDRKAARQPGFRAL